MSITLRDKHRLGVFKKKLLRKTFEPKREEIIRGWRQLRNKELYNFYFSSDISRLTKLRRIRLVRHVASNGKKREIRGSF